MASPVAILNFPAIHSVQLPPLVPVRPALQVQSLCWSLALGELEFAEHSWHVLYVAPIEDEY